MDTLSFYPGSNWPTLATILAAWLLALFMASVSKRIVQPVADIQPSPPKQLAWSLLVFALFPPVLITLHETGHFLAGKAFGLSATFSHAEVSFTSDTAIPTLHRSLFTAAGPCVEALICLIGIVGLVRWSRRQSRVAGPSLWVLSALSLACLRWLRADLRMTTSDEAKLSTMFGLQHSAIAVAMILPAAVILICVIIIHRRSGTLMRLAAALAIGIVSGSLWINTLGPKVFPKTTTPAEEASKPLAEALIGNWAQVGVPGGELGTPGIGSAMKRISKTQWIATAVAPDTGALVHWHGGTYTLTGDEYAETVNHGIEHSSELLNKTFRFKIKIEGNLLIQHGIDNPWHEVWKRVR